MPKMFVHAPAGLFSAATRERVAAELTKLGLDCEKLPSTPFVQSTVWIYFTDYAPGTIFAGGAPTHTQIMSLVVYTLEGGLDNDRRQRLIAGATEILGRHSGVARRVPAYVVIREVPERNWGLFGEPGDLQALRESSPDLPAI